MNLAERIEALRRDIAQAVRDERLKPYWSHELALDEALSKPIPRDGVDYAWRPHATPAQLRAAGVTFVVRYLSHDDSKDLTRAEAQALSAAGIDLVCVWESTGGRMAEGGAAGKLDSRVGFSKARACGMPAGRPLYFANDKEGFGEAEADYLLEARRAANTPIGLYGGFHAVEYAHAHNLAHFKWQALGWGGADGHWSPHAQLRQIDNGARIGGAEVDIDRALTYDFGQWRLR